MKMSATIEGGVCNVIVSESLTFADSDVFTQILALIPDPSVKEIILQTGLLEFVDSSGLGMFLLARDAAKDNQKTLIIQGARGQVKKIFELACFQQYFTMKDS